MRSTVRSSGLPSCKTEATDPVWPPSHWEGRRVPMINIQITGTHKAAETCESLAGSKHNSPKRSMNQRRSAKRGGIASARGRRAGRGSARCDARTGYAGGAAQVRPTKTCPSWIATFRLKFCTMRYETYRHQVSLSDCRNWFFVTTEPFLKNHQTKQDLVIIVSPGNM